MLFLLFLIGVLKKYGTEHPDPERHQCRSCPDVREFLLEDAVLGVAKAAAAIFLGQGRSRPTLRGYAVEPELALGVRPFGPPAAPDRGIFVHHDAGAHRGRTVRLEPGPRFGPECFEIAHRQRVLGRGCVLFFLILSRLRPGGASRSVMPRRARRLSATTCTHGAMARGPAPKTCAGEGFVPALRRGAFRATARADALRRQPVQAGWSERP